MSRKKSSEIQILIDPSVKDSAPGSTISDAIGNSLDNPVSTVSLGFPGIGFTRSPSSSVPSDCHILLLCDMSVVVEKIVNRELDAWLTQFRSQRAGQCPFRIVMLIYGYEGFFKSHERKKEKEKRQLITGEGSRSDRGGEEVNRYMIEHYLIKLQMLSVCEYFTFDKDPKEGWMKMAEFVCKLVKAVNEAPAKSDKGSSNFSFWPHNEPKNSVSRDSGVGLLNVWQEFLSLVTHTGGTEKSKIIAKTYPSPRTMYEAFRDGDESDRLAGLEVRRQNDPLGGRMKVGADLGRKIQTLVTETDGNVLFNA